MYTENCSKYFVIMSKYWRTFRAHSKGNFLEIHKAMGVQSLIYGCDNLYLIQGGTILSEIGRTEFL